MAKVAWIGLGVMGYPMAGYVSKAGHAVTVYNRTASKASKWAKKFGGKTAKTPKDAAKNADFVFCCVGNDDDLRSVVLGDKGAFAGMKKGAIFIDNTTASADVARELAAAAKKIGVGFVDAPVSGGQAGAENGTLTVMCGGAAKDFKAAFPVIDTYAQAAVLLGKTGSSRKDMASRTRALRISGQVMVRTHVCSVSRSARRMAMATDAATATVTLPSTA